jgi:hypothetical protein
VWAAVPGRGHPEFDVSTSPVEAAGNGRFTRRRSFAHRTASQQTVRAAASSVASSRKPTLLRRKEATMALTTGTVHTYSQNTWAYSDVVAAPDGSFYLTYKLGSSAIAVEKWNAASQSWDDYASFTTADAGHSSFSGNLDLAVDQSGHLHIVFEHEDGGGLSSFRGVSYGHFDGDSWSFNEVKESSHPSGWLNYYDPSLAVEADGDAHVTYILDAAATHTNFARYGTNESGSWVKQDRARASGGTSEIHNPTINVAPDGTLYLTYIKEDGQNDVYGNLYLQQKPSGGSWSAEVKLVDAVTPGENLFFTDSALDENGALHTFYVDDGALYDVTNASGGWATVEVLDAAHDVTGVRGYQEVEHVEFLLVTKGGTDTDLYYRRDGGAWQEGNQALSGEAGTAFAVNKDGVMMIVTETSDLRTIGFATDLAASGLSLGEPPAEAPSLIVTTLADVEDAHDGETSLREAIAYANADANTPDVITFESGLTGTIRLTGGTLQITDAVTIDGDGRILITGDVNNDDATVAATGVSDVAATAASELDDNVQVFHVRNAVAITLDGLTLTGGGMAGAGRNGAISAVGGDITLVATTVIGNAGAGIATQGGTIDIGASTVRGATDGIRSDNGAGGNAATVTHVVVDGGTVSGGSNGIRLISSLDDTVTLNSATVGGSAPSVSGSAIQLGSGANTLSLSGVNVILGYSSEQFLSPISGGGGIDTLDFSAASQGVITTLGVNTVSGVGGLAVGSFERVIGTAFADAPGGDGFASFLYGGVGNDVMAGNDGDDELYGEDGNDNFFGGLGNDRMYGGSGNDQFDGGSDAFNGATYVDYIDGGDGIDTAT